MLESKCFMSKNNNSHDDEKIFEFLKSINFSQIKDTTLVKTALTHSSYIKENKGKFNENEYNERLEFLGDAVLKLCTSDYLYKLYPDSKEGDLSKIRSTLVSDSMLSKLAMRINIDKYLLLGVNEEKNNGRTKTSTLACAFEAVLGALYILTSLECVSVFLNDLYKNDINEIEKHYAKYNTKTILQEYTQSLNKKLPLYRIIEVKGLAHDCEFKAQVEYENKILGFGVGKSKKEAQSKAAYEACLKLKLIEEDDNENDEYEKK